MRWGWVAIVLLLLGVGCPSDPPDEQDVPCADVARSDEVCIAGGSYEMGHELVPLGCVAPYDYGPVHRVRISPFFIDVLPATNGQYLECVEAGECPPDCRTARMCDGSFYDQYLATDRRLSDYPVATITHVGAEAFCRWMGKRLPTEAEWERAARGNESWDYPWGNQAPDCTRYVCDDDAPAPFGWSQTWHHPVGSNTGDVSPFGVREMVTGVPEFASDYFSTTYYASSPVEDPPGPPPGFAGIHAVRGHIFDDCGIETRFNGTTFPLPAWARTTSLIGGVRCARSDTATGRASDWHRGSSASARVRGSCGENGCTLSPRRTCDARDARRDIAPCALLGRLSGKRG